MQWTQEQLSALNERGQNLLLAAAAGSGKTTVLVERVRRLIDEGADIGNMLIVTFTRAAASDMRSALIKKLTEAARTDAKYRSQAEAAEYAGISTIHSFCIDVLREYFQHAGVDPAFRVADSAEAALLRDKAMDMAMNAVYAGESEDWRALAENRTIDQVRELAFKLHTFVMDRPDPQMWLDQAIARLELGEDIWSPVLLESARSVLRDAAALADEGYALCRNDEFLAPYLKAAEADCHLIDAMLDMGYEELYQALSKPSFARLATIKGAAEDPQAQAYRELREKFKKLVAKAGDRLPLALEGAREDLPASAAEVRALREIITQLEEEYTRLKDERALLTFGDLERRTLKALEDEGVVQALRERYTHIFIDEYQDVSDIQEAILTRIAREDNLFFVGDVKQSIYRFRSAEPTLFQSRYERYARGEGGRLLLLNSNFRSRGNILSFTNSVFARAMRGGESEILYDECAFLHCGAAYEGEDAPVELTLIGRDADGEASEEPAEESEAARLILDMKDAEVEALIAARRIRELLGTPTYDVKAGAFRPLQYRDFVILTRQARDVAAQIMAVLKREGIPAYADVSGGYLDVVEVRVAVALLRLIENRRRDVEWMAVLRSPAVGLSSEELSRLRVRHPSGGYCDAVFHYAAQETDELAGRLRALLIRMDAWRSQSRAMPLSAFIFDVMRDSGLYACVGAMPGGAQRQANLDILCDRAAAYEAAQTGGLTGFLMYLEQMSASREDMGEAHVLGENDDVVRIMTVHKSKGLEFPVVFGLLLGRPFNTRASRSEMLSHRDMGVGLRHVDNRLVSRRDVLPRLAVAQKQLSENMAEEMRILYVLLTRARDRLILTGSCAQMGWQLKKSAMSIKTPMTPGSWLDVILPAVMSMPGGEELGGSAVVSEEGPRVTVRMLTRSAISAEEAEESRSAVQLFDEATASEPDEALLAAYCWRYPYAEDVMIPRKLTASGLKRELEGGVHPPELIERPAFLADEPAGMTGAERGTATHTALQKLDLAALSQKTGEALHAEIVRQLNEMVSSGALTQAMREVIRPRWLAVFFTEGPGSRMLRAQKQQEELHREWMFTFKMSAREALEIDSDESVLVQGSIDCCFIEDGEWVLLDYKTDHTDDEAELKKRYEPQLRLYERALKALSGRPVRETMICLLRSGRTICL